MSANDLVVPNWKDFSGKRLVLDNLPVSLQLFGLDWAIVEWEALATEERPREALTLKDFAFRLKLAVPPTAAELAQGTAPSVFDDVVALIEFQADPDDKIDARAVTYISTAVPLLKKAQKLILIVIFLDRTAARLSHLLDNDDDATTPRPLPTTKTGKRAKAKVKAKAKAAANPAAAPHGTYARLKRRTLGTGHVRLPGLPDDDAGQAQTNTYYWAVLEDCLPPIETVTPERAMLFPFYPLLLHRLRGDALTRKAEHYTEVVRDTVKSLPEESRWKVIDSYVDVFRRWKTDLSDLVEEMLMSAYKLEEKDRMSYQHGRLEGRAEYAQEMLLRLGAKRFGQPDEATVAAIHAITVPHRLDALIDRLLDAASWAELLGEADGAGGSDAVT